MERTEIVNVNEIENVNEKIASTQLIAGCLNRVGTSHYRNNKNGLSLGCTASSFFLLQLLSSGCDSQTLVQDYMRP